ncbi:DNA-processing protein DprA [Intrasporangium mesophilum]
MSRLPSDPERLARAGLSRVAEPCDKVVDSLVHSVGAVEALELIRLGEGKLDRYAPRVAVLDPERDLGVATKVGARLLIPGDDEWPTSLDDLGMPPWCLWVRGPIDLATAVERSVAIVGSRTSTRYGEQLAADLAAGVAHRGWTVVSGAAIGIDGAAHRGALAVEGPTIAVVAGGVERPYPAAHRDLLERIAGSGIVVSEVAPGSAPMRSRFLSRNRLIAALTRGTVVVEADLRSGSRNTVTHATTLGRPVGAVPGPVTSMTSSGCHQEIRDGKAVLVTTADEIIDLVGELGVDACEPPRGVVLDRDRLDPTDATVLDAVPFRAGADLDTIVRVTTVAPLIVRAALARLESEGFVRQTDSGWRKRNHKSE